MSLDRPDRLGLPAEKKEVDPGKVTASPIDRGASTRTIATKPTKLVVPQRPDESLAFRMSGPGKMSVRGRAISSFTPLLGLDCRFSAVARVWTLQLQCGRSSQLPHG